MISARKIKLHFKVRKKIKRFIYASVMCLNEHGEVQIIMFREMNVKMIQFFQSTEYLKYIYINFRQ